MRWFFSALFSLFFIATSSHALEFESFSLDNGLDVVVVPDHRSPVVVHSVWYHAGSADEPRGKTGIAHMLEHMMFKGTDDIPVGEFSKIVANHGGQDNAFTSRDYTAYYQKIAKSKLDLMMEMEADRMENLRFTDEIFQPERDVILEERRWRIDSKPVYKFFEELTKEHMPNHPYGNPVIGWQEDIKAYTYQDALTWYNNYYAPNNAYMILVGDITAEDAKPLVEKYYGGAKPSDVSRPEWTPEPARNEAHTYTKVDEQVTVPVFYRAYRAPSYFANVAGEPEEEVNPERSHKVYALALSAEILGGGSTSRLYKKLVKDDKLADSVSMSYDPVLRAETSIDVFAYPQKGVNLSKVQQAIDEVLKDFIENGPTQEELDRIRTNMITSNIYSRDDMFKTAYSLGRWMAAGGNPATFDNWLEEIKNVTVEDVRQVAAEYLDLTHSTTGKLAASDEQF